VDCIMNCTKNKDRPINNLIKWLSNTKELDIEASFCIIDIALKLDL